MEQGNRKRGVAVGAEGQRVCFRITVTDAPVPRKGNMSTLPWYMT